MSLHRKWDDTAGNRRQTAESEIEHNVVNHLQKPKKSGPKTVPWSTPDRTLTSREPCPSTRTRCVPFWNMVFIIGLLKCLDFANSTSRASTSSFSCHD